MKKLENLLKIYGKRKKLSTKELNKSFDDYEFFAEEVRRAVSRGLLKPVKASGLNGLSPSLYNSYWLLEQKPEDEEELVREIRAFPPEMDRSFYGKNLFVYKKDRMVIRKLVSFLSDSDNRKTLRIPYSVNERSFQIFNDEKFILGDGRKVLSRLNINREKLNCYETPEPFFYYMPAGFIDNILIVENKDTFFTVKRSFLERDCNRIGDISFKMVIYGEGKKIEKSMGFLYELAGFNRVKTDIYYFGDIDFEGIEIFNGLSCKYEELNIKPFVYLYSKMVELCKEPPEVRTDQRECDIKSFLSFFDKDKAREIRGILGNKKYVPQEVLSYGFFRQ